MTVNAADRTTLVGWIPGPGDGVKKSLRLVNKNPQRFAPILFDLLRAMGFPTNMFTAVFALARTVGWVSHWLELQNENHGIDRPRQLYVGKARRAYPAKS